MEKHPIENIMTTTMENIRDMVDVNTVVGEAIATSDGSTVIPVSRVAFGFVAGGGEYKCAKQAAEAPSFAGGTGAGRKACNRWALSSSTAGRCGSCRHRPMRRVDRIIEMVPQLLAQVKDALKGRAAKPVRTYPARPARGLTRAAAFVP